MPLIYIPRDPHEQGKMKSNQIYTISRNMIKSERFIHIFYKIIIVLGHLLSCIALFQFSPPLKSLYHRALNKTLIKLWILLLFDNVLSSKHNLFLEKKLIMKIFSTHQLYIELVSFLSLTIKKLICTFKKSLISWL